MNLYGKAELAGKSILDAFASGSLPKALAPIFINRNDNIPCNSWSWSNRLLTAMAGHQDARGFRSWLTVGRCVEKGQHGFSILEPVLARDKGAKNKGGSAKRFLCGFKAGTRFGLSQTKVIDEDKWSAHAKAAIEAQKALEALPFAGVANAWGLRLTNHDAKATNAKGWYSGSEISLGVENLATWCHELVHAADDKLGNLTERGQHWRSETVAELGGAILLTILGHDADADVGGCYEYIKHYASDAGKTAEETSIKMLDRTCKAVALILDEAEKL